MLYIDADEAKRCFLDCAASEQRNDHIENARAMKFAADCLDGIRTADVEPIRHAHWIDKEENIYGLSPNILRVCSNCDTEYESTFMAACCAFIPSDAFGAGDDTKFPKCPCCGAKMDEEVKDDAGSE